MRRTFLLSLTAAACLSLPASFALTPAQAKAVKRAMHSVPIPELPAKAVELVSQAAPEDKTEVALAALRAAIYKQRSSAPQLVSALSKALPSAAAQIAKTAAQADVQQLGVVTSAAMRAAPQAKSEILAAVSETYTANYNTAPSGFNSYSPALPTAPGQVVNTRSSSGGVPTGGVSQDDKPINPHGPGNPNGGRFDGPPPWAAGPGREVDYTKPRGRPDGVPPGPPGGGGPPGKP